MNYGVAIETRLLDLNELQKLRQDSYKNAAIYKEKTKLWHESRITAKSFKEGQQVLVFNFRLKFFPEKIKDR